MQIFSGGITILFYLALWKILTIIFKIIGILVYLLFVTTYTLTCIMDPGIISPDYYLENYEVEKMHIQNYRVCRKCNSVMDLDKGVEHCTDCDICIIGNDHHCPWSSKCIGKKNIFMFRLFLFFLFFHIGYLSFSSVIMAIINDINKKK